MIFKPSLTKYHILQETLKVFSKCDFKYSLCGVRLYGEFWGPQV